MKLKKTGLSNKVIILFIIFFISILIVQPFFLKDNNNLTIKKISAEDCRVQQNPCTINLDGLELEVSFDKHIYYLKKFNISVVAGKEHNPVINSIHVNFKMKNMNMGVNRFTLSKINVKNNKQSWESEAILPVCVTGRADWISELEVITDKTKYIVSFPFYVTKN